MCTLDLSFLFEFSILDLACNECSFYPPFSGLALLLVVEGPVFGVVWCSGAKTGRSAVRQRAWFGTKRSAVQTCPPRPISSRPSCRPPFTTIGRGGCSEAVQCGPLKPAFQLTPSLLFHVGIGRIRSPETSFPILKLNVRVKQWYHPFSRFDASYLLGESTHWVLNIG
jgi:hypothetical protein